LTNVNDSEDGIGLRRKLQVASFEQPDPILCDTVQYEGTASVRALKINVSWSYNLPTNAAKCVWAERFIALFNTNPPAAQYPYWGDGAMVTRDQGHYGAYFYANEMARRIVSVGGGDTINIPHQWRRAEASIAFTIGGNPVNIVTGKLGFLVRKDMGLKVRMGVSPLMGGLNSFGTAIPPNVGAQYAAFLVYRDVVEA
jgi:hypothetical protein